MFVNLAPKQLAGSGSPVMEIDLLKITLEDLKDVEKPLSCHMRIDKQVQLEGFTGYFNVTFRGSPQNPTKEVVELTTAPTAGTATHWGQQLFGFFPPLQAKSGDMLECRLCIKRQKKNHRLLHLEAAFTLGNGSEGNLREKREDSWYVD